VKNALADAAKKQGIEDNTASIYAFLIERVRANLHVVLGMSPVGEPFRLVGASNLCCMSMDKCRISAIYPLIGFHLAAFLLFKKSLKLFFYVYLYACSKMDKLINLLI